MTANQIEREKVKETARANREKERETRRSDLAQEGIKSEANRIAYKGHAMNLAGNALGTVGKVLGSINDPSWYNLDPQLVKDVARLSFNTPLAVARNDTLFALSSGTPTALKSKCAGIMGIVFSPTIGFSTQSEADAVNVAAKNIYSFVRYANSGSRNYEAVDLMMYILAMDSLVTLHAYLLKAYSLINTAKSANYFYPDGFLVNMGIGSYWKQNPAELRKVINILGARINAFNIPGNLPILARHTWLTLNIFKDHQIKRSQLYHFIPKFFVWSLDAQGASQLDYSSTGQNILVGSSDGTALYNAINTMVNPLIQDEDIGIMSGDILKAYGESAMYRVQSIPDDFHIEETYSPEVLSQINSMTLVGAADDVSTTDMGYALDIRQDSQGRIKQGGAAGVPTVHLETSHGISAYVSPKQEERTINVYNDDVTPDQTMVATRLTCLWDTSEPTYDGYRYIHTFGTEICFYARLTFMNAYLNTFDTLFAYDYMANTISTLAIDQVAVLRTFDWAPRIHMWIGADASASTLYPLYDNMDNANFVVVDDKILEGLHSVATLSEYGVPVFRKQSAPAFR